MTQPPSKINILYIEDSEWDARVCSEAFAQSRVPVNMTIARDGVEAMEQLHSDGPPPDLILLDLNLPRKDGREVLAEVKADPKLHHIPIIVLTTSKADSDVVKAYDLHANAYLNKPIDPDEYIPIVRAVEEFWFLRNVLPPRSI
ncbi:MAG: response regulator [Candidatus Thermoplasmatota archaeon]